MPHYAPFLTFGVVMYILWHFMLEICDLPFYYDCIGYYRSKIVMSLRKTLNFGLLNNAKITIDEGNFVHFAM